MMLNFVVGYSLLASAVSLAAFIVIANRDAKKAELAASQTPDIKTRAAPSDTAEALAKLVEATGKLVDALTKAGPALSALGAAVLFAMVAAYVAKPNPPAQPANNQIQKAAP